MLCILQVGEKNVGELQELIGAKQAYISQQLKYLKTAGYLVSRKEGTYVYYRLADDRFTKLLQALKPLLG
ncbi:helix-turn-helix transcriptional regulator [bacterium]|nr:helix-turn-helix transcriptional regulator [bacterium]